MKKYTLTEAIADGERSVVSGTPCMSEVLVRAYLDFATSAVVRSREQRLPGVCGQQFEYLSGMETGFAIKRIREHYARCGPRG
jgi:hypothetical protein